MEYGWCSGLIQLKSDLPFYSALKESKIDRDQNGKRHAKPKLDNSYLIKGAIRQASFEAQMLHQFYYKYKLYCILLIFIQFIIIAKQILCVLILHKK